MRHLTSVTVRFLGFDRSSGPANMSRDEAILEAVASGDSPATLRVYGWRGRWLSIGLAQSIADVDRPACDAAQVGLVRRPSGGTAVLHEAQLGWSLTVPTGHPLAEPDIVESYRLQAGIALRICAILGITAEAVEPAAARATAGDPVLAAACFGALAPHEIVAADGRKLIGWGQVRRRGVVLHHTVVSLRFDSTRLASLLVANRARLAEALAARVVDVRTAAARRIAAWEFAQAVRCAHAAAGLHLTQGELSTTERARVSALQREKYGNEGWTARR